MPNSDRKQPKIPADILAAILFAIIGNMYEDDFTGDRH